MCIRDRVRRVPPPLIVTSGSSPLGGRAPGAEPRTPGVGACGGAVGVAFLSPVRGVPTGPATMGPSSSSRWGGGGLPESPSRARLR